MPTYNTTNISHTFTGVGITSGSLTVKYKLGADNGINLQDVKTWTLGVISCGPVGVSENALDVISNMYPNPTTTQLNIDLKNVTANASLAIYNTLGQSVLNVSNLTETNSINVSTLTSGVYFVTVTNGKQKATQKLVIEK